jgi:hypothetical protein
MRQGVPAHRWTNMVFQIMPRPVIKAEPAATRAPHLKLMRLGLRWSESRDKAKRFVETIAAICGRRPDGQGKPDSNGPYLIN